MLQDGIGVILIDGVVVNINEGEVYEFGVCFCDLIIDDQGLLQVIIIEVEQFGIESYLFGEMMIGEILVIYMFG